MSKHFISSFMKQIQKCLYDMTVTVRFLGTQLINDIRKVHLYTFSLALRKDFIIPKIHLNLFICH